MTNLLRNDIKQNRLAWEEEGLGLTLRWTIEPPITIITNLATHHLLSKLQGKKLDITPFTSGAFNKLYDVRIEGEDVARYVFRVGLPVHPFYKTESEVATMEYIRSHTSIPVPNVLAHDSAAENDLGYEWILMEKVMGVSLEEAWPEMEWEAKREVTKEMAGMVISLQKAPFSRIGSLYRDSEQKPEEIPEKDEEQRPQADHSSPKFTIGRIVDRSFFRGKRIFLSTNRGSYESCQKFLEARIDVEIASLTHIQSGEPIREDLTALDASIKEPIEEDGEDTIENTITSCQELRLQLPEILPDDHPNDFVLTHADLSAKNILLDPTTHRITGIVDWEFASTRPRWQATSYPLFLEDQECELKDLVGCDEDVFLERRDLYEKTQLRKLYNHAFLQAGVPTPESFNRDGSTRRMRRLVSLVEDVEEYGSRPMRNFLDDPAREEEITHERWMPGSFVAEWAEEYVRSEDEEKWDAEVLEQYRQAAMGVSRKEREEVES